MDYKKKTTLTIKDYHGQAIGDWLIARFLEMFWDDELVQEYIDSGYRKFNEFRLVEMNMNWGKWVISVKEYQQFLDNLLKILPKKYRKRWSVGRPWFKNVVPLVDMKYWPMTFEAGEKYQQGVDNAKNLQAKK